MDNGTYKQWKSSDHGAMVKRLHAAMAAGEMSIIDAKIASISSGLTKAEKIDATHYKLTYSTGDSFTVETQKGDPLTFDDLTEAQKEALKGEKGDTGAPMTWAQLTAEQKAEIKGEKGDKMTFADLTAADKAALKGEPFHYSDFTPEQLVALKGDKGDKGDPMRIDKTFETVAALLADTTLADGQIAMLQEMGKSYMYVKDTGFIPSTADVTHGFADWRFITELNGVKGDSVEIQSIDTTDPFKAVITFAWKNALNVTETQTLDVPYGSEKNIQNIETTYDSTDRKTKVKITAKDTSTNTFYVKDGVGIKSIGSELLDSGKTKITITYDDDATKEFEIDKPVDWGSGERIAFPGTYSIIRSKVGDLYFNTKTSDVFQRTDYKIDDTTGLPVASPNYWIKVTSLKGGEGDSAYDVWLTIPGNAGKTKADFIKAISGEGMSVIRVWEKPKLSDPDTIMNAWYVYQTHDEDKAKAKIKIDETDTAWFTRDTTLELDASKNYALKVPVVTYTGTGTSRVKNIDYKYVLFKTPMAFPYSVFFSASFANEDLGREKTLVDIHQTTTSACITSLEATISTTCPTTHTLLPNNMEPLNAAFRANTSWCRYSDAVTSSIPAGKIAFFNGISYWVFNFKTGIAPALIAKFPGGIRVLFNERQKRVWGIGVDAEGNQHVFGRPYGAEVTISPTLPADTTDMSSLALYDLGRWFQTAYVGNSIADASDVTMQLGESYSDTITKSEFESVIGTAALVTDNKTIKEAVNELDGLIRSGATASLDTTAKNIIGAINELNAKKIDLVQSISASSSDEDAPSAKAVYEAIKDFESAETTDRDSLVLIGNMVPAKGVNVELLDGHKFDEFESVLIEVVKNVDNNDFFSKEVDMSIFKTLSKTSGTEKKGIFFDENFGSETAHTLYLKYVDNTHWAIDNVGTAPKAIYIYGRYKAKVMAYEFSTYELDQLIDSRVDKIDSDYIAITSNTALTKGTTVVASIKDNVQLSEYEWLCFNVFEGPAGANKMTSYYAPVNAFLLRAVENTPFEIGDKGTAWITNPTAKSLNIKALKDSLSVTVYGRRKQSVMVNDISSTYIDTVIRDRGQFVDVDILFDIIYPINSLFLGLTPPTRGTWVRYNAGGYLCCDSTLPDGEVMEDRLPNITGKFGRVSNWRGDDFYEGSALYKYESFNYLGWKGGEGENFNRIGFDASKSTEYGADLAYKNDKVHTGYNVEIKGKNVTAWIRTA